MTTHLFHGFWSSEHSKSHGKTLFFLVFGARNILKSMKGTSQFPKKLDIICGRPLSTYVEIKILPEQLVFGIEHPGKACNQESLYTSGGICNGWSGISYEDCNTKCAKNETPASCSTNNIPSEGCAYAMHVESSGWCHLAGNDCIMSENTGRIVWEIYPPGKYFYFGIIGVV